MITPYIQFPGYLPISWVHCAYNKAGTSSLWAMENKYCTHAIALGNTEQH